MQYTRVARLRTAQQFLDHLSTLGVQLPLDETLEQGDDATLAQPLDHVGNRFCILPMEGWDATPDGKPSELVRRRWRNFGLSGAKLIWGGEAVAVRQDGRANPNQLLINRSNVGELAALRELLVACHEEHFDTSSDLSIGLQLTHSGRFASPHRKNQWEPRTAYAHAILDKRFGADAATAILSDEELKVLVDDFVQAAVLAEQAGFTWVDIKHCHGYLGHELLSGFDRPGAYGGDFDGRTRFLREIVQGIRAETSRLGIGVRVSVFDFAPYQANDDGIGVSATAGASYRTAWGGDGTGEGINLSEPIRFLELLQTLGIKWVCTTAGSPYYNPHIQRPALFPPSDGYLPPEDPLVGVARQIAVTSQLKTRFPDLRLVGSGYSYLQQWLPHVGQAAVRAGMVDSIGLGRMVLSYPDMPADILNGRPQAHRRICRTFSDCTTAPRNGWVSGCYPLDPFYKERPEFESLKSKRRRNDS